MDIFFLNQNIIKYGLVSFDGIWCDKDGYMLEYYGVIVKGVFCGLLGFIVFVKLI